MNEAGCEPSTGKINSAGTCIKEEAHVAKAYWIAFYESISNLDALAAYGKLAGPAILAGGGRFLARGGTEKVFEAGKDQRTVLIEFDSVEKAVATYEGEAYQAARKLLGNAAVREIRIVQGVG